MWRRAVPRASLSGSADLAQPGAGARLLPPRPLPRHAPPQPVPARGRGAGRADPRGPAAPAGPSHLLTLPALYSRLQVYGGKHYKLLKAHRTAFEILFAIFKIL